jgi:outer membrane protein OmpA-like peptidoglycan-associated protein
MSSDKESSMKTATHVLSIAAIAITVAGNAIAQDSSVDAANGTNSNTPQSADVRHEGPKIVSRGIDAKTQSATTTTTGNKQPQSQSEPDSASSQVTYFNAPPSVQQLQDALHKGTEKSAQSALPPNVMARGIQIKDLNEAPGGDGKKTDLQALGAGKQPSGNVYHAAPGSAARASRPGSSGGFSSGSSSGNSSSGLGNNTASLPNSGQAAQTRTEGPAIAVPIKFRINSAEVKQESMQYIEVVAELLAREPKLQLVIEGHTDASGNPEHNLLLSWERAYAIFYTLVEQYNIEPARLRPVGKGAAEPLEATRPSAAINRRVQFRVQA